MGAAKLDVISWGRERVRTSPWRGQDRVACLSPLPNAPLPSAPFVRRCTSQLRAQGFDRVLTTALAPAEQAGFLAAGFEVEERLHLLAHDLRRVPPAVPARLRRARADDRPAVLALDGVAFPAFWRIDEAGLREALAATSAARFRVSGEPPHLQAYAVTGRSGRRGFLQRLAVHPAAQRRGLGRALVVDALHWLHRWRVDRAVVNTQLSNEAAVALYESVGFRREPGGLCVLSLELGQ